MSREGCTSQTHDSAHLDPVKDCLVVFRNLCDESVAEVYALGPLVTLDLDLDMGHVVSRQVLARSDGLHCSRYGRMYICRNETCRLGDHLAGLHLVADCDNRICRSTKMLSYRYINL